MKKSRKNIMRILLMVSLFCCIGVTSVQAKPYLWMASKSCTQPPLLVVSECVHHIRENKDLFSGKLIFEIVSNKSSCFPFAYSVTATDGDLGRSATREGYVGSRTLSFSFIEGAYVNAFAFPFNVGSESNVTVSASFTCNNGEEASPGQGSDAMECGRPMARVEMLNGPCYFMLSAIYATGDEVTPRSYVVVDGYGEEVMRGDICFEESGFVPIMLPGRFTDETAFLLLYDQNCGCTYPERHHIRVASI